MNPREKRLIILMAVVGFGLLNLFGYKWYTQKKTAVVRARQRAESVFRKAKEDLAVRDQFREEMEWLDKHEPQPAAVQEVESALQRFVQEEAVKAGLDVKRQKILQAETTGSIYHRARVEFEVAGDEKALYGWLDKALAPDQFRAPTSLRLAPQRDDDTKVDCKVVVEQWFTPQPAGT